MASETASRLYLVWSELQARLELGAVDETEALSTLRQAALEWDAAKDDANARKRYLDHWQYRIGGYEDPRFGRRTASRIRRRARAFLRRRAERREASQPSTSIPHDIPFPVPSRKLDMHLAFVRQESRKITTGAFASDVAVFDAAERIRVTLQGTRWTQRRYPHFHLSEAELRAIHRFVQGWSSSSAENIAEIRAAAETLQSVGRGS